MQNISRCLLLIVIIVSLLDNILAGEYVSKFGQEVLAKCTLIAKGMPIAMEQLPRGGAKVISFEVTEIYQGKVALGQTIYLYSFSPLLFSNQEKWIVFLKEMSFRHNFEIIGNFSLQEESAPAKIQVLENLLKLEILPNLHQRKFAYIKYCLSALHDEHAWVRANAMGEWKHALKYYSNYFNADHYQQLDAICEQIPELSFRHELEKDMIRIRKKIRSRHEN